MAQDFPVTAAQLVALFVECILYGIYLVTFGHCARVLLLNHDNHGLKLKENINWKMAIVAILLGIIATLDVAFGLRHLLDAFVYYDGPPEDELHNISYWVNVMKTADYVAQTFIGDAMLVYRCWVVFQRRWWIVVPSILLWLGGTSCGIVLVYIFATLGSKTLINDKRAQPFGAALPALTLAMNILTTSLIVWKIWSVDRQTSSIGLNSDFTRGHRRISALQNVIRIIIESAALYTVSVFVFVVTYAAGSNANYATSDAVVQIIGISFNLIIIRVDSGRSFGGTSTDGLPSGPIVWRAPSKQPTSSTSTYPISALEAQTSLEDTELSARKADPFRAEISQSVDSSGYYTSGQFVGQAPTVNPTLRR